jgi:hypothetical protein
VFARLFRVLPVVAMTLALAAPAAASAASIRWHSGVRIEPARLGGVNAVDCASTKLCVAVDASGYVLVSRRPTAGNGSWKRTARIDSTALTGIACPSTRLCVAVDDSGSVVTSVKPTGGARSWSRPARIDTTAAPGGGYAGLTAVACPSAALCVATDGAPSGNVVVSTDPAGGARTWKLTAVGGVLDAVACPSSSLCVAAGTQHYVSTNPAGGTGAWKATGAPDGGGVISAIACPSSALCVGTAFGNTSSGEAITSNAPRTSAAWKTAPVESSPPDPGTGLLDAVGCAGPSLCVALDSTDNGWTSTAPSGGVWTGGTPIRRTPATFTNAITCTRAFCVVVDSAGVETTGIVR